MGRYKDRSVGWLKYWLRIRGIDYRVFGMGGCKQKCIRIKYKRK